LFETYGLTEINSHAVMMLNIALALQNNKSTKKKRISDKLMFIWHFNNSKYAPI